MIEEHKAWYSRGYVPHFDSAGIIQMVGFRLGDSLPREAIDRLDQELKFKPDRERLEYIHEYLDKGFGACHLRDHRIATLVKVALIYFDNQRYRLHAWVIMPNHVHVLFGVFDNHPLAKVVQSWKGFTAREANKILERKGKFWQRDYFDRFIRDEGHFYDALNYIHMNPVKACLVNKPEDWPYSSAYMK